jgi:hypothetical protein
VPEDGSTLEEIEPVQPDQDPGGLQEIVAGDDEPSETHVQAEAEPLMEAPSLPEPAPGPGPDAPPAPPPVAKAKGKSNTGLIIAIIVLVALLLCCCCVLGVFIVNFDEIAQTLETMVEATAIP